MKLERESEKVREERTRQLNEAGPQHWKYQVISFLLKACYLSLIIYAQFPLQVEFKKRLANDAVAADKLEAVESNAVNDADLDAEKNNLVNKERYWNQAKRFFAKLR